MFGKLAFDTFLGSLDNIRYGSLKLMAPNGKYYYFEGSLPGSSADITIYDPEVITNIIAKGDIGFAEDYRDKKIDTSDLTALMSFIMQNQDCLNNYIYGTGFFKFIARIFYAFNSNTLKGSKRNIHAHYDLGNQFYKLWLDESMTYSSAIYKNTDDDLKKAQGNKYDRILEILGNKSQDVIEIGCGWGGFAERAINQNDHRVKGITISEEQYNYAAVRLADKKPNANIVIEDYRKQQGKFDSIVSIEMFEAVGEKYWKTYFDKVASLLKEKGKAVIQTITIKDELFGEYRKGGDMIRSFIFPGGMLPSPQKFEQQAKISGLKVADTYFFGTDYAKTITEWLDKFDAQIRNIKSLGFDEKFIRIWRLYLATCIASFNSGRTNVMQVELQHA